MCQPLQQQASKLSARLVTPRRARPHAASQKPALDLAHLRRPAAPFLRLYTQPMHFDTHKSVIEDLEARILTIRDSL